MDDRNLVAGTNLGRDNVVVSIFGCLYALKTLVFGCLTTRGFSSDAGRVASVHAETNTRGGG